MTVHSSFFIKPLLKLGTGALASAFSEAKAITSNEFCKKSNNKLKQISTSLNLSFLGIK
jgi:hypothetical protein